MVRQVGVLGAPRGGAWPASCQVVVVDPSWVEGGRVDRPPSLRPPLLVARRLHACDPDQVASVSAHWLRSDDPSPAAPDNEPAARGLVGCGVEATSTSTW